MKYTAGSLHTYNFVDGCIHTRVTHVRHRHMQALWHRTCRWHRQFNVKRAFKNTHVRGNMVASKLLLRIDGF